MPILGDLEGMRRADFDLASASDDAINKIVINRPGKLITSRKERWYARRASIDSLSLSIEVSCARCSGLVEQRSSSPQTLLPSASQHRVPVNLFQQVSPKTIMNNTVTIDNGQKCTVVNFGTIVVQKYVGRGTKDEQD